MDRDPSANVVDDQDRTTPTTGESPYGEHGSQRARAAENQDRASERPADDEGRELEHDDDRHEDGSAAFSTPLPPD